MDEKTAQLAQQLKNNPSMIRTLMQSRDGQLLMQMLTRADNGKALQQATMSATRGDASGMANLVQQVMRSPEGADLIRRIQSALEK